jgi:hypothetical protein
MLILTDAQPRGLGYYEVDNRAAGLPAGETKYFEADTYTCSHCERVVILNPERKRERYKCGGCSHHICDDCAAKKVAGGGCRTYAQFIDELRERDLRQTEPSNILLP